MFYADSPEPEDAFPHLCRTIAYNNSIWAAVYHNLRKAWQRWVMISKVMNNMGATVQVCEVLYKVVAHMVLLYGSNIWVMTGAMLKVLEGFHHQADRRIVGMTAQST